MFFLFFFLVVSGLTLTSVFPAPIEDVVFSPTYFGIFVESQMVVAPLVYSSPLLVSVSVSAHHAVFVTTALQYNLRSSVMIPVACFLLKIALTT